MNISKMHTAASQLPVGGRVGWMLTLAICASLLWASALAQPITEAELEGGTPAVVMVGLSGGFPAYQSLGVEMAVQAGFVGFAARAAWGPGAVSFGGQLRGYLPLPIPAATFVGVGFDAYDVDIAPHVVFGAHLPIAENWRINVSGGAAFPETFLGRTAVPFVSAGFAYAFDTVITPSAATPGDAPASGSRASVPDATSTGCVATTPDEGLLNAALRAEVNRFVRQNTAVYGSIYRDLTYQVSETRREVNASTATLTVAYSGSVVERLGGRLVEAAGTAEVDFRWTGCSWSRTALRY